MKKVGAENLPAYEPIKAALAKSSDAPTGLSPDRRARIRNAARAAAAFQPTFADRLARWFDFGFFPRTSARYAVMRAVFPVCLTLIIVAVFAGLMLPAVSLSRGRPQSRSVECTMMEPESVKLDEIKDSLQDYSTLNGVFPQSTVPPPSDRSDMSHRSDSFSGPGAAPAAGPAPATPAPEGVNSAEKREPLGDLDEGTKNYLEDIPPHLAKSPVIVRNLYGNRKGGAVDTDGDATVLAESNGRLRETESTRSQALGRYVAAGQEAKAKREVQEVAAGGKLALDSRITADFTPAKPSEASTESTLSISFTRSTPLPTPPAPPPAAKPEPAQPSNFRAAGFNPFVDASQNPFSTFSIDVDTAAYTLTRNFLMQNRLPPPEAVRTEEVVNFFDYHYPAPAEAAFAVHAECAPAPFGPGLQLLRIGVKARRLGREENRPAMLLFLIDTSGSMSAPDRLELVKQSLRLLVDRLAPEDRVAIVQYDSHARLVLDYTPAADKARILKAIAGLQTSGSTNLEEGMRLAYELARRAFQPGSANRVLLLSDGAANLGSASAEEILATVADSRRQGIFCSVYGVGRGGYNDVMLETLANKGDGTYTYLDSLDEARRVFVDDLAATLNTVAADVKIQVEFNPARVTLYRQLGYENRMLRKEDFRNDAIDAGEVGSGQSVTALYELTLTPNGPRVPLGIVRIRYRDLRTGRVGEIESPLSENMFRARWADADAPFKLAACAAEFAEILRGSPFAADSDGAELAALLRPVALDYALDSRVQELLRLVEKAGSLKGAGK